MSCIRTGLRGGLRVPGAILVVVPQRTARGPHAAGARLHGVTGAGGHGKKPAHRLLHLRAHGLGPGVGVLLDELSQHLHHRGTAGGVCRFQRVVEFLQQRLRAGSTRREPCGRVGGHAARPGLSLVATTCANACATGENTRWASRTAAASPVDSARTRRDSVKV